MSMSSVEFDVAIMGAGLVGASLAAGLRGAGLGVAVIEHAAPPAIDREGWDNRVYAISPGSVTFLEACGAWSRLETERLQSVLDMRVWGDDGRSRLDFSSLEIGRPDLAQITEGRRLQAALWQAIVDDGETTLFCPAACTSIAWEESHGSITLSDGRRLRAKLVVGADGADSWVRRQAGILFHGQLYRQQGVVANFACANKHDAMARQWFRPDGVLALLPLPGSRVSMVWSTWEAQARQLVSMPGEALCEQVREASHDALGALSLITPATGFPLRRIRVERLVAPRVALVGDAAHVVHPLAGQGVNLGFRDARELAAVLRSRGPVGDCGALSLLRRYERARKEDILTMMLTTDALQKLFASEFPSLGAIRNWGLGLAGRIGLVRSLLIQHAVA
jgi:ubiquinone biosynthesis UbiH/UbiF/VisC/COQ6 family hydroxylase